MSADSIKEDVTASGKDEEINVTPATIPGGSNKGSSNTDKSDITEIEEQLLLNDETDVPENLRSIEPSSIDKSIEETTDNTNKLGADELALLMDPVTSIATCSNKDISLEDINTDIAKDNNLHKESIKLSTSTSNLEDIEKNDVNQPGYKETAIDDASDSDLELHWTDDDDDENDQMDAQTSCNKALKQLDEELNINEAKTETKNIEELEVTPENTELIDNKPTVVKNIIDSVESETFKTDSDILSLHDDVLKPVDEDTAGNKKVSDESIDTAVAELQQLIDEDDEMVEQKSKCTEEKTKPVETDLETIITNIDKDLMDVDEPSEIDVNPIAANTNIITLDKRLEEPDVIPTDIEDITEPITMPESGDRSGVSKDQVMDKTDDTEMVSNIQETDNIVSKYAITASIDHTNESSGTQNASTAQPAMDKIISKDITIESSDRIIDDSHTEMETNNDEDIMVSREVSDNKMGESNNKDLLKTVSEKDEISKDDVDKVIKECDDKVMNINDDIKLVSKIKTENVEMKNEGNSNIMTKHDSDNKTSSDTKNIEELDNKNDNIMPQKCDVQDMGSNDNTEIVLKIKTDEVVITDQSKNEVPKDDVPSGTDGKTTKESDDHSISQETKGNARDGNDSSETAIKIEPNIVDIPKVTDAKMSNKSDDDNVDSNSITEIVSEVQPAKVHISGADDNISKESKEVLKDSENQAHKGIDNTESLSKIKPKPVEKATELDLEMEKEKEKFVNVPILSRNDKAKNDSRIETKKDEITLEVDEFITPDTTMTSDSIKINKDHRINRPDVMLDIPTQEFDFDEEFDETTEILKDAPSERNKDGDGMTAKTVTEIVNQLAKDGSPAKEITINVTDKVVGIDKTEDTLEKVTVSDDITTSEKEKEPEKVIANTAATEKIAEIIHKVFEKENDKSNDADNYTIISQKPLEKDPKPTEKVEMECQPSTSEVKKMTPDILEEAQEVTDSLLAVSSRVLDEDDEDDEPEPDEYADDADDDDDEFHPEDEESSNQTTEHSEESNPPHSEVDIQEDSIDFGNEADSIGLTSDSNYADDEVKPEFLDNAGDITIDENDPVSTDPTENVAETKNDTVVKEKAEPKSEDSKKEKQPTAAVLAKRKDLERRNSILMELLKSDLDDGKLPAVSPKKLQNLEISHRQNVVNIVDLEESSSDDDIESKQDAPSTVTTEKPDKGTVSTTKSTVLKSTSTDNKTVVPAAKDKVVDKDKTKDEIFNLDSDEEESAKEQKDSGKASDNRCINYNCTSLPSIPYYLADRVTVAYYGAARRRRRAVCQNCYDVVKARNEGLLAGIKDFRPLMSLRMARPTQQLLEISDSDSEGEDDPVGPEGAKLIEENLTDLINQSWIKYKLDDRLKETEDYLDAELEKMQKQSEEIDELLKNCQQATDSLRLEFYSGFEPRRKELPAISLHDTPIASYTCLESEEDFKESSQLPGRYPKRRSSSALETPAKKQAIPLGYAELGNKKVMTRSTSGLMEVTSQDDDKDISVVRLSAEVAPADLPPPGELVRPPLRPGQLVYAMKNQYGAWLRGKVLEILTKSAEHLYTQCRIRFDHKVKNPCKVLSARSIAYTEPSEVRMTIGTRVIALFKNSETTNKRQSFYYSGVIAEIPNPVNNYRYLVFFDDGYAQYVAHAHTRLVCESSELVWEEVHPFSRDFVCNYLIKYPERPMVRLQRGHGVTVEWNGVWWDTKVVEVDAALVKVHFPDNRSEWIYRGSTRLQPLFAELQAARRGDRARLPRSTKANTKTNMPYVEYTRSDDQAIKVEGPQTEEMRKRAVAKKSTTSTAVSHFGASDGVVSKVVFYTPKNSVRPYKMVPHTCGPQCNRTDLLTLDELRTYNPLTKPLLSGWERQIVRHKYCRAVMYRAPCGRRVRSMRELHRYLRAVDSEMAVDLFDFSPNTHCLAEFVLNKNNVHKKDLSHGKENVPVPCVNYYDDTLPEFCSYNTERTPTNGVPLNTQLGFLCGCVCEDDCADKTKCACWKMTLEGARTIGIEGTNVGYEYRRLPEPLPTGIYECNPRCHCKATCLNRVVQNPLQLKLQVFKTLNRGWGIRALNDVPKGSFLCIYAGNLLTDATANLDGLNEGDEYLAELDYIEVVEAMKEGYEEDVLELEKKPDKKIKKSESDPETESSESEEEEKRAKSDEMDDDFQPGYLTCGVGTFSKRLRRRDKSKEETDVKKEEPAIKKEETPVKKEEPGVESKKEDGDECITISDDEEVRVSQREPSRFTAQEGMTESKVVPKYRSIRTYFGEDEACYIMDAKVQGNIGRYLNHSCSPNVFVQNVFVDTHDPRFPWVSFFALHHIRAGTELTWNYNYDIGSVPGKVLYCFCGAPNCRGRLL